MNVNLKSLVGKLNPETRSALEGAAGLCLSRTNYDVEIEHYLMKVLDASDGDVALILKHFGVDRSKLARDQQNELSQVRRKAEADKAAVRTPAERQKIDATLKTRLAEVRKRQETEKAKLNERQKAEAEAAKARNKGNDPGKG